jgi:hypothetical protein
MNRRIIILFVGFFLASLGFLLFSYTQVDLSLTLSRSSIIRDIETAFQYIGWYNRPLATSLYIGIVFFWFFLYGAICLLAYKKKITISHVWMLVFLIWAVLFFSYPAAFSYDIFNYVFTAKTVVLYHQNPYVFSPILFEHIDPMLSFMRWTHLPSAYTPLSISMTIIPYMVSFGQLLFSLWFIRAMFVSFYILTIWSIAAIIREDKRSNVPLAMAIFAFNPLVITEILISGHNDSMMMGLALFAMSLALQRKRLLSFFVLSLSVAAKLMTIFLLPLSFLGWKKWRALALMSLGLFLVLVRREFVQWYFLWILPFIALFPLSLPLWFLSGGISIGLLLRYAPVFYTGNYNNPVPFIQNYVLVGSTLIGLLCSVLWIVITKIKVKKHST